MQRRTWFATGLSLLILTACHDNPGLTDPRLEQYTAELSVNPGHVHTLGEVTFSVTIENGLGATVTDFASVSVERKFGTDQWRAIPTTLMGQQYMGSYTFMSSGEYHLRVMATHHEGGTPVEVPLHEHDMGEMMVGRAHAEVEGVRFEFENFPGHVHEGDQSTVKFWIMQAEKDASGVRPPIPNFGGSIVCDDPIGISESHAPDERTTGVYEATHTWQEGGDAKAIFRFTKDGATHEAPFAFRISAKH